MNIVVNGRNVDVTPALRKYAEDKISKFEKYLSNITEATVTLSVQRQNHKAEVLIKANGVNMQAEGSTQEFYSAIDEVASKLDRQVKKHKEKKKARRKSNGSKAKTAMPPEASASPKEQPGTIIKKRPLETKPMPPEEAAMNLEMSGQAFFVFINDQSGEINVIYRMNDGNLGLYEPSR